MIQLKRGSTSNWRKLKTVLQDGQPGYDIKKHKIKIGDGETSWSKLPYASGLASEDILYPEAEAKIRSLLDPEDTTLITYGTDSPDENTVGQVYLQYYDTAPEVDYIVDKGTSGIWQYQIWASGMARCWGTLPLTTKVSSLVGTGALYSNEDSAVMTRVKYPFAFATSVFNALQPSETATVYGAENKVVWLACKAHNTTEKSGLYTILSYDKHESATYGIVLDVKGYIDKSTWKNWKKKK